MPRLITSTPAARLAATLRSSSANRYGGIRSRRSLCLIKLLVKVVAEAPGIDRYRPATEVDIQVLSDHDLQFAAVEHDLDGWRAASEPVGDGGAAGAGPGRHRLSDSALEDPRADHAGLKLDV